MDFQLAEEVAVVVGGARGIGRAVAEEFAQQRAMVAIVDINPAALQTAQEIAEKYGVRTTAVVADVTNAASLAMAEIQLAEAEAVLEIQAARSA